MSDERWEELGLPRRAFLKRATAAAFAAPVVASFALDGVAEAYDRHRPHHGYPNQTCPNQHHPNQAYPNQTVPNQAYPNQTFPNQHHHRRRRHRKHHRHHRHDDR